MKHQPKVQPVKLVVNAPVTKCATCVNFDCGLDFCDQFMQKEAKINDRNVVLECTGYSPVMEMVAA